MAKQPRPADDEIEVEAQYFTVLELAQLFRVSRQTVSRLIVEGQLAHVRFGDRRVVGIKEVKRYLAEKTKRNPPVS